MIPLQWFADGVICRPKHLGVHEAWVNRVPVCLKIQEGVHRRIPRRAGQPALAAADPHLSLLAASEYRDELRVVTCRKG